MDRGNAAEAQTVIVNTCDFECVWFCLQPLYEFVAEVADRDDGDAATKTAGLRPPPDQCTKTKAKACQQQERTRPEGEGKGAQLPRLSVDEKQAGDQGAGGENDRLENRPDLRTRGAEAIECIGTLRREDDATRPRADSGGERQKTAQRRLKPRTYAYRRKPGRGSDRDRSECSGRRRALPLHFGRNQSRLLNARLLQI